MTAYPFLVHLGRFTITGYGLMLMAAFLIAGWVFAKSLERNGYDNTIAWDSVVMAVIGGLIGGKVYYALLVHDWNALVSRGGLVWYGGFIGGVLAVAAYMGWKKHPIPLMGDIIAPALAAGYSVGRIGCFLVGDDYGVPTLVPWAVAFPQGSPPTTARMLQQEFHVSLPPGTPPEQVFAVHPTQLYEVFIAFGIFMLLWRLGRHRHGTGWLLGLYLALMGMERLFVEIFRAKDDRFFGPFTLAQVISVIMIGVGGWLVWSRQHTTAKTKEARA
jgi:phosphatidylglycerol:prolipoprotein diacylglycerol transferase